MSTNDHTPGPWSFGGKGRFQQHIDGGNAGPKWFRLASVVVRLDDEDQDNAEGLANARLIAAAPDLLEALEAQERFSKIIEDQTPMLASDLMAIAKNCEQLRRAAITKAITLP